MGRADCTDAYLNQTYQADNVTYHLKPAMKAICGMHSLTNEISLPACKQQLLQGPAITQPGDKVCTCKLPTWPMYACDIYLPGMQGPAGNLKGVLLVLGTGFCVMNPDLLAGQQGRSVAVWEPTRSA